MTRDRDLDSRRLKAARALRDINVETLAKSEHLRANQITANLIGETERKSRDARPIELRAIAEALEVPAWFFETDVRDLHEAPAERLDRIEAGLDELLSRLAQGAVFPRPEGGWRRRAEDSDPSAEDQPPQKDDAEEDSA